MASTAEEIPSEIAALEENDNDDDDVVDLVEVVAEQDKLEADARAVLGGADDSSCTYSKGYVKRQPLYSCLTCSASTGARVAGVCYGCSVQCHDGHELVELYTKRNFRCDCGNSRFDSSFKCVLNEEKDTLNDLNQYNQNFEGTYCTCHRPYPDPEDYSGDEMFQCIVCEDWLHSRHSDIENDEFYDDEFYELVCPSCAEKLPFIRAYSKKVPTPIAEKTGCDSTQNVVVEVHNNSVEEKLQSLIVVSKNPEETLKSDDCVRPSDVEMQTKGPILCSYGWRERLCRCEKCSDLYRENKCEFILDHSDTIEAYEDEAKANESASDPMERGLKLLNEMDRFKQVELLTGYNSLKDDLTNYLTKFSSSGKVVREEDIKEFFEEMKANKRQRLS